MSGPHLPDVAILSNPVTSVVTPRNVSRIANYALGEEGSRVTPPSTPWRTTDVESGSRDQQKAWSHDLSALGGSGSCAQDKGEGSSRPAPSPLGMCSDWMSDDVRG